MVRPSGNLRAQARPTCRIFHARRAYLSTAYRDRKPLRQQQRPADTAPPLAIEPIPQPRRRPPEPKTTQQPMHREKPPAAPNKDPAKMSDAELEAAKDDIRTQCGIALFNPKHPLHRDALELLPQILPGVVIPNSYLQDALTLAA